ncbi:MAG: hypothetical protein J6P84_02235 [Alphaproteobacteria bacterium]|nr:hypothetical protein [Alphaproteobacteria bacterium]
MKKALIIANMLFASATVFGAGFDQAECRRAEENSLWTLITDDVYRAQLRRAEEAETERAIENSLLTFVTDAANREAEERAIAESIETENLRKKKSENMSQMSSVKDMFHEFFEIIRSRTENADWLSEDAKLLFSQLKFEDVWEEIERILFSDSPTKNSSGNDSEDMEFATKEAAKSFFERVLGKSSLGKDLYDIAEYAIDQANLVKRSDRNVFGSFNDFYNGIKCEYYDCDDLLLALIHETGHSLDWFYRIRKKYGNEAKTVFKKKSISEEEKLRFRDNQQSEYVSMFFESLLKSSTFKGRLYSEDSSAHRFRLLEIFITFTNKIATHELLNSYDKDQLGKLLIKDHTYMFPVAQKLRENDLFNRYIEIILKFPQKLLRKSRIPIKDLTEDQKLLWERLLHLLKGSEEHKELYQCFLDIDKGKRRVSGIVSYSDDRKFFKFSENLSGIPEIEVFIPKLDGIDPFEIYNIALEKQSRFTSIIQGWLYTFIPEIEENKNLDNHTEGAYNAFRLIKEKGYFDILENGQSLSIEEVMGEFTKPAEPLNLNKKSTKEFLEFLTTGKFKPHLKSTAPKIVLNQ